MKNLVYLFIFIFVGCATKKITTTETKTDTIKIVKKITIQPKEVKRLVLRDVCDTSGIITPFMYEMRSKGVKTVLKSINDTIYLEQNIDSIKNELEKTYKSKTLVKEKVIVKYKKPIWVYLSLFVNFLLISLLVKK